MNWEMEAKIDKVLEATAQCSMGPNFSGGCPVCPYYKQAPGGCVTGMAMDTHFVVTEMRQLIASMEEGKRLIIREELEEMGIVVSDKIWEAIEAAKGGDA